MLLWIDGFDNYGTTLWAAPSPAGVIARKYAVATAEANMRVAPGRFTGYGLRLYNSAFALRPAPLTTDATVVFGAAVMVDGIPDIFRFLIFFQGSNGGVALRLLPGGELGIYDRAGTQIAATTGLNWTTNVWRYLECKIVCGESGSYEVRVGGVTVLSGTADTRPNGLADHYDTFQLYAPNYSGNSPYFDDLYFLDGTGDVNNDFLGNMRVVTIRPQANGDTVEFTPDSGDNYDRVNETVCGDDTNYVEDTESGHQDLYDYADITNVADDIKGIQINTDCRETDATSYDLITTCVSNAVVSDDTPQAVASANYITRRRVMETNPDGDVAWTKAALDAAQFGVKVG